jgi:SHS2 domain-containing protein
VKKPRPKFEIIEHTADFGIKARGRSLKELFFNLAGGMLEAVADIDTVEEKERRESALEAPDTEELLVSFFRELIYLQSAEEMVFRRVEIEEAGPARLRAAAVGEKIDPGRHDLRAEIKAVTYHQLKVEKTGSDWTGQVIFDV